MFEHIFKTALTGITGNEQAGELWNEIKTNYSKQGRYYHSLSHLDHLVSELLPVKTHISDWQTLVLSMAYHDIIYNVLKRNNEEKSAAFAHKRLSELSIPVTQRNKCFAQIIATKNHSASEEEDTNYFIDADLSILGTDSAIYLDYTNKIRKEYKLYPDVVYKPGRRKVLQHFLQMPHIYKTSYFCTRYEEKAKANLENELNKLSL